ncbi:MAG: TolB protein [Chloroflexota bacterium]|nr:TolB protein [Chloroflexota bacterium]
MKKLFNLTLTCVLLFLSSNCNLLSQESGPCSRIAYTYSNNADAINGDVYSVCADGTDVQRLTDDPAYDGAPAWSPDGTQLAFVSQRSGSMQTYLMDADGDNQRALTDDMQNDMPIWLPGGEQIAFRTTNGDGLWWWRVISPDGGQIADLTEASFDFFFQKQDWSPTAPQIAYMSLVEQQERNDGSSQIHVRAVDGSGDRALTDNIWANVNPVWSPDGQRLAFLSEMHGTYNTFALYVMDADGGNVHQISEPQFSESALYSWSPDGKQIAIGDIFQRQILLLDVASGRSRELLPLAEGESMTAPAWQP